MTTHGEQADICYGDPRLPERFWEKVEVRIGDDGREHWLWTGSTTNKGYGSFYLGKRRDGTQRTGVTHKMTWELVHGRIPNRRRKRLVLDHTCRLRGCCNPACLELVVEPVNVRRGISPAGNHARKTHCPKGHEYTEENTYTLRIRKDGRDTTKRYCRACRRRTPLDTTGNTSPAVTDLPGALRRRAFGHLHLVPVGKFPGALPASSLDMTNDNALERAPRPAPTIRYWLGKGKDYARRIRVEWRDRDGDLRTSYAWLPWDDIGYRPLKWIYDMPPEEVRELALECLIDDYERGVDGAELVGYESKEEMSVACEGVLVEVAA